MILTLYGLSDIIMKTSGLIVIQVELLTRKP